MNFMVMLDELIRQIIAGKEVSQEDILPHLCLEGRVERCRVNCALATAFSQAGNIKQAKIFADRAWLFSDFSEEVFKLYKPICEAAEDVESLRAAYKRLGIRAASEGRIERALTCFTQWQYAYNIYHHMDRYEYDFDIMDCVERMALPYRPEVYERTKALGNGKIRLAYLVYGMPDVGSVVVKINLILAAHHNKDLFEITFFVPESLLRLCRVKKRVIEHVRKFRSCGCNIVFAKSLNSFSNDRLVSFARQIKDYNPDILITSVAIANYKQYFMASLRPAPLTVALLQGPPEQFVSPFFDHAVSWSKHPLIDSPIDTSLVKFGVPLPEKSSEANGKRASLGLSEDAVVLMSAGRHVKFQNQEYWQAIVRLMESYPHVHYVVVGVLSKQVAFLDNMNLGGVHERLHFLGWRSDCVELLSVADILIDTYPSSGGHVLIDTMALGVPFVSFKNNFMKRFDQTEWSVAEDYVEIAELMVPRGDFCKFSELVGRLISDPIYRIEMGKLCEREIHASMPTAEEGVRQFETVLLDLAKRKLSISPELSHINAIGMQNPSWLRILLTKLGI